MKNLNVDRICFSQGESTSESGFRMDNGSGETVLTLDREVEDNVITTEKITSRASGGTNSFSEAVKMFSTRGKLAELSRKPFFALAKSAKVNLQPWPSATNLRSYPVTGNVWNERDSTDAGKFKIPSIDVRQTSLDYELEEYDDKVESTEEEQNTRTVSSR